MFLRVNIANEQREQPLKRLGICALVKLHGTLWTSWTSHHHEQDSQILWVYEIYIHGQMMISQYFYTNFSPWHIWG